ncbi:MAG TPA: nickel-dependent hydrogenase large subunit [Terriglobales bacterium]
MRVFENILKGRDPRDAWAFTKRACSVCTTVHALASVRTVEDSLAITVPKNADLISGAIAFVEQFYLPDLMSIAGFYKAWAAIGGDLKNYLAYGDLPTRGYN